MTPSRPKRARWQLPSRFVAYLFVAPFFLLFAVFGLFPAVFSLWLAFQSWVPTSGLDAVRFVGWDNFLFVLGDEWFWQAMGNTLWLALASALPQHLVALPLAAFVDRWSPRGRDLLIGAYFAPYITSTVAVSILFSAFFSADYGLANLLMQLLGGSGNADWLGSPHTLRAAISVVVFWHFVGFNLVLYLAAMKAIPRELYEAAALDRAPAWRQFIHITLPGLRPMVLFAVTLSVIGGLQMMEEPFMLTDGRGGVDHAGMTVAFYLYRMAFDFNDFGGAAAMSWLLFGVVIVLTVLTQRLLRAKP